MRTILDSFYDLKEWEALEDDELKAIVKIKSCSEYEPCGVIPFSRQLIMELLNAFDCRKLINEHNVNLAPYSDELIQEHRRETQQLLFLS